MHVMKKELIIKAIMYIAYLPDCPSDKSKLFFQLTPSVINNVCIVTMYTQMYTYPAMYNVEI